MKRLSALFLTLLLSATMLTAPMSGLAHAPSGAAPELDNELVSVTIDGKPYDGTPVSVITDQVFQFRVTVRNTGTAAWGQASGERGSTLFSRGPDYNENFGTFFISPGQEQRTPQGTEFTYVSYLRAPGSVGAHTMRWQTADWIIPYIYDSARADYTSRPFFGEEITVGFAVSERAEQPPGPAPHVKGVLDASDFEYEGSFDLPRVPRLAGTDADNTYFESGMALREYNGEKRLLLGVGTYDQQLYEVAIPNQLGKIVGDGKVNNADLAVLWRMENYNRGEAVL